MFLKNVSEKVREYLALFNKIVKGCKGNDVL